MREQTRAIGENLTCARWLGTLTIVGSILFVSGVEIRGKSLSINQGDAGVEANR